MAIDDSSAPKSIPNSGEVSPGSSKADRSINLLKNIKTSTSRTTSNTSIDALRNWFRTYVGTTGNFSNNKSAGQQVNLSDFHDSAILGIAVTTTNETSSTYGTNNNAKVFIRGYFSEKFRYSFETNNQTKTAFHGNNATFTGFDGGTGSTGTEYVVAVNSFKKNVATRIQRAGFRITTAYKGTAKVRGNSSTGEGSFGVLETSINFTYSGGAGAGKTSNAIYLLHGKQDPSGRTYGPSFTYP
jgi:hypothetical protein